MNCPSCGHKRLMVLETRNVDGVLRRRRQCLACGERVTTIEVPVALRRKRVTAILDLAPTCPSPPPPEKRS